MLHKYIQRFDEIENFKFFFLKTKALFSSKKNSRFIVTSNLASYAWSIKYRRKQKLITQFTYNLRDEFFELVNL
jgi:hypothetical protein